MALVCVGSAHGAPGATTVALLAAGCWPRPAVLVELDPAGGVLAARYRLGRSPGLAELAAAAASHAPASALWESAQELPGGLGVAVAPESGDVTHAILADAAASLGHWCGALDDVDVIADCGRLTTDSPTLAFVRSADATWVVARSTAEELYPAAHRLHALERGRRTTPLGLVLVGDRPHGPREVSDQLGVRVLGVVADDARTARVLRQGGGARAMRRSPLVRSVQSLVDDLTDRLGIGPPPPVFGGRERFEPAVAALPPPSPRGESL